jgi:hypothetical protein
VGEEEQMAWNFERVGEPFGDVLDGPVWDGDGLLFCKVLKAKSFATTRSLERSRRSVRSRCAPAASHSAPTAISTAQSGSRRVVWFKNDGSTAHLNARVGGLRHNHPHDSSSIARTASGPRDPYSELHAVRRFSRRSTTARSCG